MTKEEVSLVQHSWVELMPRTDAWGEAFYGKLFKTEPLIKHLFHTDIKEQACKLTNMFTHIIAHLKQLDNVKEDLYRLGERHNQYKVKPEYYMIVGESLLLTLEQQLAGCWTIDHRKAWLHFLQIVFEAMMQGQGNYIWPYQLSPDSERK